MILQHECHQMGQHGLHINYFCNIELWCSGLRSGQSCIKYGRVLAQVLLQIKPSLGFALPLWCKNIIQYFTKKLWCLMRIGFVKFNNIYLNIWYLKALYWSITANLHVPYFLLPEVFFFIFFHLLLLYLIIIIGFYFVCAKCRKQFST